MLRTEERRRLDAGGRTYSLGNSPRANEHRRDVLPHAPVEGEYGPERVHKCEQTRTITNDDELSADLKRKGSATEVEGGTKGAEDVQLVTGTLFRVVRGRCGSLWQTVSCREQREWTSRETTRRSAERGR